MSTPGDFKKGIKEKIDKEDAKSQKAVREAAGQSKPRRGGRSFGYMRLAGENPYIPMYRDMLQKAGITKLYDDTPAVPGQRPQFEAMLKDARPNDTIVLVRFNHLSMTPSYIIDCVKRMCEKKVDIKLIQFATIEWPSATAVLHDLANHFPDGPMKQRDGGDSGSGNGGP